MFDPATINAALSSAKATLDLVKNAKDAQLAMKISSEVANAQGRLIDVQQQTLSVQDENQRLRNEITQLKAQLADTGQAEPCPSCHKRAWRVVSTSPDPTFAALGVSRRVYKCDSAGLLNANNLNSAFHSRQNEPFCVPGQCQGAPAIRGQMTEKKNARRMVGRLCFDVCLTSNEMHAVAKHLTHYDKAR